MRRVGKFYNKLNYCTNAFVKESEVATLKKKSVALENSKSVQLSEWVKMKNIPQAIKSFENDENVSKDVLQRFIALLCQPGRKKVTHIKMGTELLRKLYE